MPGVFRMLPYERLRHEYQEYKTRHLISDLHRICPLSANRIGEVALRMPGLQMPEK